MLESIRETPLPVSPCRDTPGKRAMIIICSLGHISSSLRQYKQVEKRHLDASALPCSHSAAYGQRLWMHRPQSTLPWRSLSSGVYDNLMLKP